MRLRIAAALGLIAASSLHAQSAQPPAIPDLSAAAPLPGSWTYSATADGSEAVFSDAYAHPQLWVHCTRADRQVAIAKAANSASPFLGLWTSAKSRALSASFDPAAARLSVSLPAFDPLLDAIAFSRGRMGVVVAPSPPLVLPAWSEVARVIEDCRV